MKFGRVEGFIQELDGDRLRLIVTLETGSSIETVRDEVIEPLDAMDSSDLVWLADQYTQETIGHHLASEGWEAIGAGEKPDQQPGAPSRSSVYAVRNLG